MADQATTLEQFQRWWASLGDDMRRQAGQPTWGETRWRGPGGYIPFPGADSNIAEHASTALMGLSAIRPGAATAMRPSALSAQDNVRLRARDMAAQAQRDYYARMMGVEPTSSPAAMNASRRAAPTGGQSPEYARAVEQFRTMQRPERLNSVAGVAAGGAAYPYADDDLDMWWSRLPQP